MLIFFACKNKSPLKFQPLVRTKILIFFIKLLFSVIESPNNILKEYHDIRKSGFDVKLHFMHIKMILCNNYIKTVDTFNCDEREI